MTNMNETLIITGMHRSGTSLLSRFFEKSGFYIGKELYPAHPKANPYGHFEDKEFLEFQMNILRETKTTNDPYCMWPSKNVQVPREYYAKGIALIDSRRKLNKPWAWKDPRTCLFLDFWADLIPEAKFFLVFRAPISVVDSQARREKRSNLNFIAHNRFLSGWIIYNLKILFFYTNKRDRCILGSINGIINHPNKFIELLNSKLSCQFNLDTWKVVFDSNILKKDDRNYRFMNSALMRIADEIYQNMLNICEI